MEGIPSDAAVGMPLVATDMEPFQQVSGLLVEKLEVVNRGERLATELCSSSASRVKAETWSTRLTYCGMPWFAGYEPTGTTVSSSSK